jgi:hypothetical protein
LGKSGRRAITYPFVTASRNWAADPSPLAGLVNQFF